MTAAAEDRPLGRRRATGAAAGGAARTAPVLMAHAPRPATAGDVAHVPLILENGGSQTRECALCVTDLIGVSGHRIPAAHARVSPSPARIPAAGAAEVRVEIRVPSATPAGSYTGLVQAEDGESFLAVIRLVVGADGPANVPSASSRDTAHPSAREAERRWRGVPAAAPVAPVLEPSPNLVARALEILVEETVSRDSRQASPPSPARGGGDAVPPQSRRELPAGGGRT